MVEVLLIRNRLWGLYNIYSRVQVTINRLVWDIAASHWVESV